jgi:hypothetical protein
MEITYIVFIIACGKHIYTRYFQKQYKKSKRNTKGCKSRSDFCFNMGFFFLTINKSPTKHTAYHTMTFTKGKIQQIKIIMSLLYPLYVFGLPFRYLTKCFKCRKFGLIWLTDYWRKKYF